MSTKYDDIKDTYCYYAMQGFSTHAQGRARPCCVNNMRTSYHMSDVEVENYPIPYRQLLKNVNTIEEFINDPVIMDLRKKILIGEKPSNCKMCWDLEDAGIKSFRQITNDIHDRYIDKDLNNINDDGYLKDRAITYLDITLGNICNLRCRTCNPWSSHRWLEEGPYVPHTKWDNTAWIVSKMSSEKPWFIKAFSTNYFDGVLPNVKTINFLGGEPLVVTEHYEWLKHIIKNGWSKDIELCYNTNGTTIPKELLEIWKNFKKINIALSLDAYGDLAYYVRYPSKWHVIEKNIEKLKTFSKETKCITVHVHITISVLNIHDLGTLLSWCLKQYNDWHYCDEDTWNHYGYQNAIPHFNIVENPEFMHVRHLPLEIKEQINQILDTEYEKYKNMNNIPEWEQHSVENIKNIKNMVNQERSEENWIKFVENTRASDKFRKVNIVDYIPWMKKYI